MSEEPHGVWVRVPEKQDPHWKEFVYYEYGLVWAHAYVKWDGCIGYTKAYNEPMDKSGKLADEKNFDSMHICEIDDEIARLQKLKAVALAEFGDDWAGVKR